MLTSYEISISNYLTLHRLLLYEPYNFIRHYCTVNEPPEKIRALAELRHCREFHGSLLHVSKLGSQPTLADAIFKDDNLVYEGRIADSHSHNTGALRFESGFAFKGIANAAFLQVSSMTNLRRIAELVVLNDQKNVEWLFDLLTPVMIPEFIAMFLSRNVHINSGIILKCDNFLNSDTLSPLDRKIRALVLICGMGTKALDFVECENVLQKAWLIVTIENKRDFGTIFDTLWTAGNERQDLQYWGLMAHMSALVLSLTQDCSRLIKVVLGAIPDHLPPALSIPLLERYTKCLPAVKVKPLPSSLLPSHLSLAHLPLSHLPLAQLPLQVKLQHWTREGPGMTGHLYKIPPGPLTIVSLYKIVEQPYRQIPSLLRMALPLNLIFDEPYLDKTTMHFRFTDAILAAAEEVASSKSITPQSLSVLMASWTILLAEKRRMELSGVLSSGETWRAWAKRITDRMNIGPNFVLNRLETWRISTNFTPAELLELVHKSD